MAIGDQGKSNRAGSFVVGAFALSTLWFSGVFPPFSNPNELSRFQIIVSFVETGGFEISEAIRRLGNHEDKALSDGRVYSNKAPGLAFAAIPVYRGLRVFLGPPVSRTSDPIFFLLRILTVSVLCAVALARFRARLSPSPAASLVALAVAFGTPFLFYARSFFGHAWTAALLFLAWDLVKLGEGRTRRWETALAMGGAGLLAGWAGISEYTVAPLVLLLAIRASVGRSWRRLVLFFAGACVPLALLLAYNAVCFGSPWVLSSAREAHPAYAEMAGKGLFGFGPPDAEVAAKYLFHPARGLLLFSPFWLWLAPGFLRWWRSGRERADCFLALSAVVLFFILLTGYPNWHGGWSLGNRYLLPLLFFAGLALPYALESLLSRGLFAIAAVYSSASHLLLTMSWPHFPADLLWPPANGSLWFLSRGWIAPSLLSSAGWLSLLPPVAFAAAAAAMTLRAARPTSPPASLAALYGVALLCAMLLFAPEPPYNAKLWRAAIYGAYSGLDPSREELKRAVLSASTPLERRRAANAWRLYGPR